MATPKEDAYDTLISPLIAQVIALCKEHKINAFATFALDAREDDGRVLRCTTSLPVDKTDEEGFALVEALHDVAKPPPTFAAFTIITKP